MYKIELKDMEFYAYHGCFSQERVVGNRFVVNLCVEGDFSRAAESDDIGQAVNYQDLYDIVKSEMEKPSALLENVAKRILSAVKEAFPAVEKAKVTVDKLNPPLGGKLYASSVTYEL